MINCDILDFTGMDTVIPNNSTNAHNLMLTACMPLGTIEDRMHSVGNRNIEFKPVIESCNTSSLETEVSKSYQSRCRKIR